MNLKTAHIKNFKCYKGSFKIDFSQGVNILVGENETGKSTILEAIHLALSGVLNGHYLRNELSQYLFNNEVVESFLSNLKNGKNPELPCIHIELFFDGHTTSDFAKLQGDNNSMKTDAVGVSFKVEYDESFNDEYEALLAEKNELQTLPIEFYKITWKSFARDSSITTRSIPIKSVLIDSSNQRYKNGSDVYISRIIKNNLNLKEKAGVSQAFRQVKESFMSNPSIEAINKQVKKNSHISTNKNIEISVDLSTQNAWETTLMTYLDNVPFHQIGKGEQCIIKTNLSLSHKKSEKADLILLEEPENHLTHSKLNEFIKSVTINCKNKQIIISTHSSFVANKLGLENLILLSKSKVGRKKTYINELPTDTQNYFKKLSGYDTLRFILCKKAILVEGDSDELVVQKAYMDKHDGCLPIENRIDVISVRSLAFKRFLDIAKIIEHPVAIVTDNDGKFKEKIIDKYEDYEGVESIKIFADEREELNTLEPQIVDANKKQLDILRKALGIKKSKYNSEKSIVNYMVSHKTDSALKLFETAEEIKYPRYIKKVIKWCDDE
ncbi:ATP-dependent endonuclease [Arenibacter sp. ARW7G5Y1]|uniref:ATP-dependent nuclease n=1 Tax=Arenibacter sp. ARW7G5Y1 TaxID=2135619 RepID=UPI000D75D09A|nr:AAA family ATPase [Arenibacter sp. ARW7G5Y1]PXX31514.1 putative ATP-dependent endonuclease of OLD family [Arenibacter sp. ARW7G5Y1]